MDTYEVKKLAQTIAKKMYKNPELKNIINELFILNKPETLIENYNTLITTRRLPSTIDNPFVSTKKELWIPQENGKEVTVNDVLNQEVATESAIISYQINHIENYVNGIDNVVNFEEVTTNAEFKSNFKTQVINEDYQYYIITTRNPVTNEPYTQMLKLWQNLPYEHPNNPEAYAKVRNQLEKIRTVNVITHQKYKKTPMYNWTEYLKKPLAKNEVLIILKNKEGVTDSATGEFSEQDCTERNQLVIDDIQAKIQKQKFSLEKKCLTTIKNIIKTTNQEKCNNLKKILHIAITKEISTLETNEDSVLIEEKIKTELQHLAKKDLKKETKLAKTINEEQLTCVNIPDYSQPSTSKETITTATTLVDKSMSPSLFETNDNIPQTIVKSIHSPKSTEMNWDFFEKTDDIPQTIASPTIGSFVETRVTNTFAHIHEQISKEETNNITVQDVTTAEPLTSRTQKNACPNSNLF